ncbi:hypothetical protein MKK70_23345 [Methylobacterium sp. E-041]|jgi:hypothetical protein|uniref:hypothetical protein n=1 Tax=unclassified Methylobacterium TaxID=2615210 RepID=UPI001FB8FF61|nr:MULTISPECIES: hypothetical protein [unclassified Methylobacterium]MCJ2041670.1 hypothetical protein [Methylobacterium sp. J-059]MCJ2108247.1 hypothetical protein [Methylobacterium sp. E-041]MCJ2110250.1 hypothetical protein [Methylobacterium sp. E-025]
MTKAPVDQSDLKARLERIAHELGLTIGDLYGPADPHSRHSETRALVEAFDRIIAIEARARCIAFVTAEADKS